MSYDPKEWTDSRPDITTDDLTRIEDGIRDASSTADQALATATSVSTDAATAATAAGSSALSAANSAAAAAQSATAAQAAAQSIPTAAPAATVAGTRRRLSEFAGATDDAKLAAFASWAAAQTYKGIPVQLDEPRAYTFAQPFPLYNGFGIIGDGRPVDQARSSMPIPQRVSLRTSGGWLRLGNGNTFGVHLGSLSFDASATSRVFEPNPAAVLWTTVLRDISFQNGLGIIGSSTQFQPVDAIAFDGYWNLSNVRDVAFNVGGSDCYLTPSELLIDSPTAFMGASGYEVMLTSFSKSFVSNMYLTCDQHTGINVSGGNKRLTIKDSHIEGRNASTPCYGALVRIASDVVLKDCWTSYAMSNPAGNGRSDLGVIDIASGNVLISGCTYERANGVAESVPYIAVRGGNVRIRDIMTSGAWTGKPVVRVLGGTVDADNSVTVVKG